MSQINRKTQKPQSNDNSLALSNYSPKTRLQISFPAISPYTKQEFKDECDINILMNRYMESGELPNLNERSPQYLDVTGFDYQSSMEFVAGAKTLFNELPSTLRNRFENDPAQFLDFCSQEKNRPEMAELGLLKPQSQWVVPLATIPQTNAAPAANTEPTTASPSS